MDQSNDILDRIRNTAAIKVLFLPHALQQMLRPDRMIRRKEIRNVIEHGEIIEDYPDDARGHSCLMLGFDDTGRPIHVVCSPKEDFLAVITAYLPDPHEWTDDFKTRRNP